MRPPLTDILLLCLLAHPVIAEPGPGSGPTPPPQPEQAPEGASKRSESSKEVDRWMEYQYILHQPERTPEMVGRFLSDILPEANEDSNALGLLAVFVAQLGKAHPDTLDAWTEAATKMNADAQFVFSYAVWVGDPDACAPRIRRITDAMPADAKYRQGVLNFIGKRPPDIMAAELENPGVLDFWWVSFMATGDTAYVARVMTALPPRAVSVDDADFGDDPTRAATASAASWSLRFNAWQHPRVLAYLKEQRASEPGPWPALDEIIKGAEELLAKTPSPAPSEGDHAEGDAREPDAP